MAKSKIPDPLERRHLLEREIDGKLALRIAEAYVEADRAVESLAFFEKAGASEQIEGIGAQAIEAGDAFLFRQVCSSLGREPKAGDWERLAEHAERNGLERYAATAHRQLDLGEN